MYLESHCIQRYGSSSAPVSRLCFHVQDPALYLSYNFLTLHPEMCVNDLHDTITTLPNSHQPIKNQYMYPIHSCSKELGQLSQ